MRGPEPNGCNDLVGCVNGVVRSCIQDCRRSGRNSCVDDCRRANADGVARCESGASEAARNAFHSVDQCLSTECTIEKLQSDRRLLRFDSKAECLESVCSAQISACR